MHLHANSMNILARLQSAMPIPTQSAANVRRDLAKRAFQLHHLGEDGTMASQWDGDARRQPGRNAPRTAPRLGTEDEVLVEEPVSFWG